MSGCLFFTCAKSRGRVSRPDVLRYNRVDIFSNATGYGYVG